MTKGPGSSLQPLLAGRHLKKIIATKITAGHWCLHNDFTTSGGPPHSHLIKRKWGWAWTWVFVHANSVLYHQLATKLFFFPATGATAVAWCQHRIHCSCQPFPPPLFQLDKTEIEKGDRDNCRPTSLLVKYSLQVGVGVSALDPCVMSV